MRTHTGGKAPRLGRGLEGPRWGAQAGKGGGESEGGARCWDTHPLHAPYHTNKQAGSKSLFYLAPNSTVALPLVSGAALAMVSMKAWNDGLDRMNRACGPFHRRFNPSTQQQSNQPIKPNTGVPRLPGGHARRAPAPARRALPPPAHGPARRGTLYPILSSGELYGRGCLSVHAKRHHDVKKSNQTTHLHAGEREDGPTAAAAGATGRGGGLDGAGSAVPGAPPRVPEDVHAGMWHLLVFFVLLPCTT